MVIGRVVKMLMNFECFCGQREKRRSVAAGRGN
jgi:hypothetical protein